MLIDGGRRHPLCPKCRYDLVATVKAGGNVCPECGVEFEPHELMREVRPGDWTETRGLKHLAISLATRSAIAMGIWALWLWLVSLILISHVLIFIVILLGHTIMALVVARVLWTGLRERCGFDGLLPAGAALLADWVVVGATGALIGRTTPLTGAHVAVAAFIAAITAAIVIIPLAILDE